MEKSSGNIFALTDIELMFGGCVTMTRAYKDANGLQPVRSSHLSSP